MVLINETSGQEGYDGSNDAWLIEKIRMSLPRVEKSISSYRSIYILAFTQKQVH